MDCIHWILNTIIKWMERATSNSSDNSNNKIKSINILSSSCSISYFIPVLNRIETNTLYNTIDRKHSHWLLRLWLIFWFCRISYVLCTIKHCTWFSLSFTWSVDQSFCNLIWVRCCFFKVDIHFSALQIDNFCACHLSI